MDPQRLLERMCARHGLDPEAATSLVPLIKRALESPAKIRDRILSLVETNLARRAETRADSGKLATDLDHEVLLSVAKVLHNWAPSAKVLDMGGILPKLFPDGVEDEPADD